MTYRDELMKKTANQLYGILYRYEAEGGELNEEDMRLFEEVGDEKGEDERSHDKLVDLIERLHDDDLL